MEKHLQDFQECVQLDGHPVEEIREKFGKDITNDCDGYIDANYKSILVTFNVTDGIAHISPLFEMYNDEGVFLGTCQVPTEE